MGEPDQIRTWAFVSLLVGGVLIALSGLMRAFMFGSTGWFGAMPMGGMTGAYGPYAWGEGTAWLGSSVGLIAGAFVLAAAYHVRQPRNSASWSIVAIVAGAATLLAMGGYAVGALAAIVGGVLGLVDLRDAPPRPGGS